MASIPKTERILDLISALLRARRPMSRREICETVAGYREPGESADAAARRFERDKATLRALGVPLTYVADDGFGREGYVIERRRYFLSQTEFTPEEVALLALAGRAAPATGPLGAAVQSALAKLEFDAPIPSDVRSTVEERFLFHHPSEPQPTESARLETLCLAVLDNRTVTFEYTRLATGETVSRRVDPYGLAFWGGHWYLVGHSHERGAVRTFRVDRMGENVAFAGAGPGPDFAVPAGFHIEQYVGAPPWRLGGEAEIRVAVRLDSTVAWMVRESSHPTDAWTDHPDGSATVVRRISDEAAFFRWLWRLGPHAELLSPLDVRQRFVERTEALRRRYDAPVAAPGAGPEAAEWSAGGRAS